MAVTQRKNPASGYIRIAMVHRLDIIEEAMKRLRDLLKIFAGTSN